MKALTIKDLSVSTDLDRKAMSAVRGGNADQANGASQLNLQNMLAAANVGNGIVGGFGPIIIQSDNDFSQDASNSSTQWNDKSALLNFALNGF